LQSLIVAAHDFDDGFARRVLVVANATLKYNWADEIEKWTTFTYEILEGTPTKRDEILNNFDADILIVNYEQIGKHLAVLNEMHFDIFIGDEFHLCKNPKSHRTKATLKVLADRYFLMTGSPMLNRVNELWTSLHRIDPSAVPNYWQFCAKFCVYGGFEGKQIVGVKNQRALKALLDNMMLRRLKKDDHRQHRRHGRPQLQARSRHGDYSRGRRARRCVHAVPWHAARDDGATR
jgi:SNF2 family DNA or RNA helicase